MNKPCNLCNYMAIKHQSHQKLSEATQSHIKLGGANIHKIPSDAIPATFLEGDNIKYHRQCY